MNFSYTNRLIIITTMFVSSFVIIHFIMRHFLSKPILHRNREEFLKRDSFSAYQ